MKQTAFCKSERARQRCYEDAGIECKSCENMTRKSDEDGEELTSEAEVEVTRTGGEAAGEE